jgi:hypothetical protein
MPAPGPVRRRRPLVGAAIVQLAASFAPEPPPTANVAPTHLPDRPPFKWMPKMYRTVRMR